MTQIHTDFKKDTEGSSARKPPPEKHPCPSVKSAVPKVTNFPKYDHYKDSGVEWLGEVPAHWEVSKARWLWKEIDDRSEDGSEELLSISQYTGVTATSRDSRSESLEGYRKCKPNDLAMNIMLAWQGGLGISNYDGIVSPAYSIFRLASDDNPHYLGYLYRTRLYLDEFGRNSTGIVPSRWRIYPDKFGHVQTLLPPKPEQDRIVAFLDEKTAQIDALIAKKERQIELLEEQKAIRINQAVTRGLNPKVKLKPSGIEWIGEIPEHWEVKRIRHAFRVIDCKHLTVPFNNGGFKLISIGELDHLHVDTTKAHETDEKHFRHLSDGERRLQAGDLIFSRNASVGKCSIVVDPANCSMGQDVCLLRPHGMTPEYAIRFLRSPAFQKQIAKLLLGSTFNRINISELKNLYIIKAAVEDLPDLLLQIEAIDQEFNHLSVFITQQIQSLKTLRSTLIAHAVTGKIKV